MTEYDQDEGAAMNEQKRPLEETTGRFLVTLKQSVDNPHEVLNRALGIEETVEAEGFAVAAAEQTEDQAVVFERLGIAVVAAPPAGVQALGVAAAEDDDILYFEPERVVYTCEAGAPFGGNGADITWGLKAIGADATSLTGEDVEVAILDTGVALEHPDLGGRNITTESFVPGVDVEDLHGHGTHCIGTACGSAGNGINPRYGVAPGARIFAGKVLGNNGRGVDTDILAGIEAAIDRGSRVASLSLGGRTRPDQPHVNAFEEAAQRARKAGTLVIAAAGNDSKRPGVLSPVSHPANCPSILAVGAVDQAHAVAPFSNQGTASPGGGRVDIAGPGVGVYSMALMPKRYRELNGTSMATPHVAGVAALLAQANPGATPDDLATMLIASAKKLQAPAEEVGAGLVQAP